MSKKYSYDDLCKAIDYALSKGDREMDMATAKRDVTGALYKMYLNLDNLWIDLETDYDKLLFLGNYIKSLHERYAGKCKEIEMYRDFDMNEKLNLALSEKEDKEA